MLWSWGAKLPLFNAIAEKRLAWSEDRATGPLLRLGGENVLEERASLGGLRLKSRGEAGQRTRDGLLERRKRLVVVR